MNDSFRWYLTCDKWKQPSLTPGLRAWLWKSILEDRECRGEAVTREDVLYLAELTKLANADKPQISGK